MVGYSRDSTLYRIDRGTKIGVDPDGRPNDFTILAIASLSPGWVSRGVSPAATLGVFTNTSGGLTFQAATTDWPTCVPTDRTVECITRNVLNRLQLRSARLVGPVPQEEDMGIAPLTEGKISAIYVDLGRLTEQGDAADDLAFDWRAVGCDVVGKADGPVLWIRPQRTNLS